MFKAYRRWRGSASWCWTLAAISVSTVFASAAARDAGTISSPGAMAISLLVTGLHAVAIWKAPARRRRSMNISVAGC
jgi:hypothetical protein